MYVNAVYLMLCSVVPHENLFILRQHKDKHKRKLYVVMFQCSVRLMFSGQELSAARLRTKGGGHVLAIQFVKSVAFV